MQTEEASTGQVFSTQVINDTPLDGRNYVYIAQLAAGVAPPSGIQGAAGTAQMLNGSGDFTANGQRIWQNNFILDGVDNNSNLQDFLNGATYVMRPPPDALQEFKVQTSDYSAELGHSAGAVVNASIKSGTNLFHGSLWEYLRNNALDATDFFDTTTSGYHQNQFGATLGGPIWKSKLFFFADAEATRISYDLPPSLLNTVPTAKMRSGDFTEMLNPNLTTGLGQIFLYQVGGNTLATSSGPEVGPSNYLTCNGVINVICPNLINPVAQKILNLFPMPNTGVPGQVFNNYNITGLKASDNPLHYDVRLDWNANQLDRSTFLHLSVRSLTEEGSAPAEKTGIRDATLSSAKPIFSIQNSRMSCASATTTSRLVTCNRIAVLTLPPVSAWAVSLSTPKTAVFPTSASVGTSTVSVHLSTSPPTREKTCSKSWTT